jgi:hypothetical protein
VRACVCVCVEVTGTSGSAANTRRGKRAACLQKHRSEWVNKRRIRIRILEAAKSVRWLSATE